MLKLIDEKQKYSQDALKTLVVTLLLAVAFGVFYFHYKNIKKAILKDFKDRLQKQIEDQTKENEDKDAGIAVLKEELSKQKDELLNQKVTIYAQMSKLVVANAQKRKEKNIHLSFEIR